MKIGKTTLIIIAVIVAAIIMFYVWKKNTDAANAPVVLSDRVQQLVDRVPYETRKKIVDHYAVRLKGDVLILRDGKVFNTTQNKPDPYNRTSIEVYRMDGVLWDMQDRFGLIDASTKWWLDSNTMKFTLVEFQQSLQVK